MALHGENLKMGKDVRGIERGKCACGECEDFMRSDGATCGYCGCLPTPHSKKDACYSSDSVGSTSGAGTSESPEKWKDGREPDDFQPRAEIKRFFEESELVSGDSEAIRRFQINTLSPKSL